MNALQACPGGSIADDEGSTSCSACDAGTFSTGGASACIECQPGSWTNSSGSVNPAFLACLMTYPVASRFVQASCPLCSAGTYQVASGRSSCEICRAGSFSAAPGMSVCFPRCSSAFLPSLQVKLHACFAFPEDGLHLQKDRLKDARNAPPVFVELTGQLAFALIRSHSLCTVLTASSRAVMDA
jgi:hypothetical protein